jgi:hypothetical protein
MLATLDSQKETKIFNFLIKILVLNINEPEEINLFINSSFQGSP